jgi:hypothetical protein
LNEPGPVLSVVIAATDSPEAVARAIASIGETSRGCVERIVASTSAAENVAGVRWIRGAPGSGVPHLRRLGLDQARGPIVVFSEDSCVFSRGWLDCYLDAFDDERTLAASGPVLPGLGARSIDWAVFFCEYAVFLPRGGSGRRVKMSVWSQCVRERSFSPPCEGGGRGGEASALAAENGHDNSEPADRATVTPPGPPFARGGKWPEEIGTKTQPVLKGLFNSPGSGRSAPLAGNNFAIRRDLASELDAEAIHESEVNSAMLPASKRLERAEVWHVRRYGLAEAIQDRLRFGFEFGLRRGLGLSPIKRLTGIVAGPAILAVQVARLVVQVVARPRYLGVFLETLPITLALLTAWSVGEWLGWSRAAVAPLLSRR